MITISSISYIVFFYVSKNNTQNHLMNTIWKTLILSIPLIVMTKCETTYDNVSLYYPQFGYSFRKKFRVEPPFI